MSLTQIETDRYADLWTSVGQYGHFAPGEVYGPLFPEFAPERGRVLDAGCGTGKAALVLRSLGYDVTLCDLTPAGLTPEAQSLPFFSQCLWQPIRGRYDYGLCCDVLEHIQPQFTMLVVDQVLRVCRKGALLSISLVPDAFGAWVGAPLHLTVQPFTWWRDALKEVGQLREARDLVDTALFWIEPR